MKILEISFFQSKNLKNRDVNNKHNIQQPKKAEGDVFCRSTLAKNSPTFCGAPLPKEFPYSAAQKEREVAALRAALNGALKALESKNFEFIDENQLSQITGLDINLVKLRLTTNNELRNLHNRLKIARIIDSNNKKEEKAKDIQAFFEKLKASKQKLTERELSFYLGLEEGEIFEFTKDYKDIASLFKSVQYKPKKYTLLEKRVQNSKIGYAIKHSGQGITYKGIGKKTGYNLDAIRAAFNENKALFDAAIKKRIFPPEIYSKEEVEAQDEKLMDIMIYALKQNTRPNI